MNIEVSGRIRPHFRTDGKQKLSIDKQNRIANTPQGSYFSFQTLHRPDSNAHDVYRSSLEPLLNLFISGFNCCLFVLGESGAGKSYTVEGGGGKAGLVQLLFENLFLRLNDSYPHSGSYNVAVPQITLQMHEVYNETIKDLLRVSTPDFYCDLEMDPDKGVYIKGGTEMSIKTSADAVNCFRQGWSRKTDIMTDYGPSHINASIIIFIDVFLVGNNGDQFKSRFTLAELPGLEKITEEEAVMRTRQRQTLSQGIRSFRDVVMLLSRNPQPRRVITYNGSKLTQILQNEMGGNCKTHALVCLKPNTEPSKMGEILRFCSHLSQVKTYPAANDQYIRGLECQHRSRIMDLTQQMGVGPLYLTAANMGDVSDDLRTIQAENVKLLDQNDLLKQTLDQMRGKYGDVSTSKSDLSHQLLRAEEEKLKVSQKLVEVQLENNRIKEESESQKFELNTKLYQLENDLIQSESEREKYSNVAKDAVDKLTEMETDRKDLLNEYVNLKSNYVAISKEREREVTRNEELSLELLNLVNAKATLANQLQVLTTADNNFEDPQIEVNRIQNIIDRYTPKTMSDIKLSEQDRDNIKLSLMANENKYQGEIFRIRNAYDENTTKLGSKISTLNRELTEARKMARERQQKLSECNSKLVILKSEKDQLETLYNRSQHKIKDLNDQYRSRLTKYVQDIGVYVDKQSKDKNPKEKTGTEWKKYIEKMISDVKDSFKQREEQLSQAAKQFKGRLRESVRKNEELLTVYLKLKTHLQEENLLRADYLVDESNVRVNEPELRSLEQKEICRLKEDLSTALNDLDYIKSQVHIGADIPNDKRNRLKDTSTRTQTIDKSWSVLRKELRDFTLNTQQDLEKERAELMTENQILREQLKINQDYIDSHLIRYKDEIVRLRHELGMDPTQPVYSPRPDLHKL